MRRRSFAEETRIELNMTPMIDVVFQLLIFFMFTLRPVVHEGQFEITMSTVGLAKPSDQLLFAPLAIYLEAGDGGELSGIVLGDRPISDFDELTARCLSIVGGSFADELEAEIHTDDGLRYKYLIEAVNSLTRARISKINFAPGRG